MRIDAALIGLLALACGGASRQTRATDPCHDYLVAMVAPIDRMMAAADRFEEAVEKGAEPAAQAARDLARVIDEARAEMGRYASGRADLDAENQRLAASMTGLASAYRGLADGIATRAGTEAARVKLRTAEKDFSVEATRIREICPEPGSASRPSR